MSTRITHSDALFMSQQKQLLQYRQKQHACTWTALGKCLETLVNELFCAASQKIIDEIYRIDEQLVQILSNRCVEWSFKAGLELLEVCFTLQKFRWVYR